MTARKDWLQNFDVSTDKEVKKGKVVPELN
jgi:hypothetical protein